MSISKTDFHRCLKQWKNDWNKCIKSKGDYFEAHCDKLTIVQITSEVQKLFEQPMCIMGQN